MQAIKNSFKNKVPELFNLYYFDEDNDKIFLASDDDLLALFAFHQNASLSKSIKIFIDGQDSDNSSSSIISKKDSVDNF